jgi:hypothetical protein
MLRSPTTLTVIVLGITGLVTVPLAAVVARRRGCTVDVAYEAVTDWLVFDSVTGNESMVVPAFPSTTEASPIESDGLAAVWTRRPVTLVAEVPTGVLMVTLTFSSFPCESAARRTRGERSRP